MHRETLFDIKLIHAKICFGQTHFHPAKCQTTPSEIDQVNRKWEYWEMIPLCHFFFSCESSQLGQFIGEFWDSDLTANPLWKKKTDCCRNPPGRQPGQNYHSFHECTDYQSNVVSFHSEWINPPAGSGLSSPSYLCMCTSPWNFLCSLQHLNQRRHQLQRRLYPEFTKSVCKPFQHLAKERRILDNANSVSLII
jgi:hypothetical protein